jgi:hypothetical protein
MAGLWVPRFAFFLPRKTLAISSDRVNPKDATTGLRKANTFDLFDGKTGGWGARVDFRPGTLRNVRGEGSGRRVRTVDNQYFHNPNSRRSGKVKVTIVR